jgi:hypothetical protein
MWIRWKYVDHCRPDWAETEVPDSETESYDTLDESIHNWLCDNKNIPTWSERFMPERVKWEKLELSEEEIEERKTKKLKSEIEYHERRLKECKQQLKKHE